MTLFPIWSHLTSMGTSGGPANNRPGVDLSPESTCSSPGLSRLTYISMNDGTLLPAPDRQPVR